VAHKLIFDGKFQDAYTGTTIEHRMAILAGSYLLLDDDCASDGIIGRFLFLDLRRVSTGGSYCLVTDDCSR
jgi:hypothetical protein